MKSMFVAFAILALATAAAGALPDWSWDPDVSLTGTLAKTATGLALTNTKAYSFGQAINGGFANTLNIPKGLSGATQNIANAFFGSAGKLGGVNFANAKTINYPTVPTLIPKSVIPTPGPAATLNSIGGIPAGIPTLFPEILSNLPTLLPEDLTNLIPGVIPTLLPKADLTDLTNLIPGVIPTLLPKPDLTDLTNIPGVVPTLLPKPDLTDIIPGVVSTFPSEFDPNNLIPGVPTLPPKPEIPTIMPKPEIPIVGDVVNQAKTLLRNSALKNILP
jgi:hypothetical protein